jgi:hypothetical protein
MDVDGQRIGSGCDRPNASAHSAHPEGWVDVEGEQSRDAVDHPFVHEFDRPSGKGFLGRLKDDPERHLDFESSKDHRNAGRDRGMGIVTTSVHPALPLGSGRVVRGLLNGESVDVRPETHPRLVTDVDPAAGLRFTIVEFETANLEESSDQLGCPVLAVCRLGVSMEETAQFERIWSDLLYEPCQLVRASHVGTLTGSSHS